MDIITDSSWSPREQEFLLLETSSTITDFLYNRPQILVLMLSIITRADCSWWQRLGPLPAGLRESNKKYAARATHWEGCLIKQTTTCKIWYKNWWYHKINGTRSMITQDQLGSRDGAVVRVLASHQCGPGLTPGLGVKCGLSLLLVLVLALKGFSPGTPVFPSP